MGKNSTSLKMRQKNARRKKKARAIRKIENNKGRR